MFNALVIVRVFVLDLPYNLVVIFGLILGFFLAFTLAFFLVIVLILVLSDHVSVETCGIYVFEQNDAFLGHIAEEHREFFLIKVLIQKRKEINVEAKETSN